MQLDSSEPSAAADSRLQVSHGLNAAAGLQLLHHQIRLDPQQQRLAGVGTTGRRLSLQRFRLDQSLFTELKMAVLKAALSTGLKSGQRR